MRGLAAQNTAADNSLRILNRDAALAALHQHDERDHGDHHRQHEDHEQDVPVAGRDLVVDVRDRPRQSNDDARKR